MRHLPYVALHQFIGGCNTLPRSFYVPKSIQDWILDIRPLRVHRGLLVVGATRRDGGTKDNQVLAGEFPKRGPASIAV